MKPTFKLDTLEFHKMLQEMQRLLPAVKLSDIIDYEVGRVLESTIRGTKTATKKSVDDTFLKREMLDHTIPAHNPKGWYKIPSGKRRIRGQRIKDSDWQEYKAHRSVRLKEIKSRIGFARQGFVLIADQLGINLSHASANRARLARVNGKVLHKPPSIGRRIVDGNDKYTVAIEYRVKYGRYIGAEGALQRAINGRVGYFNNNIKHGVFRRTQDIAKRYPGLLVQ